MQHVLWSHLENVRKTSPLVQSITNYVVMNNTANALLAIGASPIMAHAHPEMQDMVRIINALVINIGTLDEYWVTSMHLSIDEAITLSKPWVLDPVGAGASTYRNEVLQEIIIKKPTVIRGNASEIMALAQYDGIQSKGVDSTQQSNAAIQAAQLLSEKYNSVVCISGAVDYVVQKQRIVSLTNGDERMPLITGLGCTATAMIGAYLGLGIDPFEAVLAAMAQLTVAAELAGQAAKGPGSLQMLLIDKLYTLSEQEFKNTLVLNVN